MTCTMEILDATGHLTLEWTPDDPESVKRAEAEFERLREAGFAFFTSASPDADRVEALDDDLRETGALDARLERTRPLKQTRKFKPRARRTVAVPPQAGG